MNGVNKEALKQFVIIFLLLTGLFIIFYWRLLFTFNGFLGFGNFMQPLNLKEITGSGFFYSPNQDMGSSSSFPLSNIEYWVIGLIYEFGPALIFGLLNATKIYILLSSVTIGISFYFFTGIFSKRFSPRIAGTVFYLFNPFSMQLYTQGDFSQFIFISLSLVGVRFLYLAMASKNVIHPYYLVSSFFFVMSLPLLQSLITSGLLYLIIIGYVVFFKFDSTSISRKVWYFLKSLFGFFFSLISVSLIFSMPIYFNTNSYLPGSISSLSLGSYLNNWLPVLDIISLHAYYPYLAWTIIQTSFSQLYYKLWTISFLILVFIILFSFIKTKRKESIYFAVLAVVVGIISSETPGPISILDTYLYLHFTGFQAVNYPYIWVWLLLVPIYSILIIFIFTPASFSSSPSKYNHKNILVKKMSHFKEIIYKEKLNRIFSFTLIIFIAILFILPMYNQQYYGSYDNGNTGIRETNNPTWIQILDNKLVDLTKTNNSAVLFNDNNILQSYSDFRTISLPYYIPNFNSINNYYIWLYHELQDNKTRYSAELSAFTGVQYFVFFNNSSSSGNQYYVPYNVWKNQIGWKNILSTPNYTIYQNTYYSGSDYYTRNFSLLLGNYNTMNSFVQSGFNIDNTTILYPTDLIGSNFKLSLLNAVNQVMLSRPNYIYDLIPLLGNGTNIYPGSILSGEYSNINKYWINSERNYNSPDLSEIVPYAETNGNNSFNLSFNLNQSGKYTILASIYFSQASNNTKLMIANNSQTLASIDTYTRNITNGNNFTWITLNTTLAAGKNTLSFMSYSGFNAVSQVFIANHTNFTKALNDARKFLQNKDTIFPNSSTILNSSKVPANKHENFSPVLIHSPSGFTIRSKMNGFLVLEYPFQSSFTPSTIINSGTNGLVTIVYITNLSVINISLRTFYISEIAILTSAIIVSVYLAIFWKYRRNQRKISNKP